MPQVTFEIQAQCPVTRARAGVLRTPHGDIETPVFMPVGTQATVKGLSQHDLSDDLDARIILCNTYHLYLRPGHETIRHQGGLHQFMSWPRAILTDSGGFQVFSLSGIRRITEEGVIFNSHLNGDAHTFTPESTVDVQLAFGSDILMALDECPEYPVSHEYARQSMHRTVRWARAAYRHYQSRIAEMETRHALFPIVQGSMYTDLSEGMLRELAEFDADGYAIGGLSVGEPRPLSLEMVEVSEPLLPRGKPRYAMGVGMPDELAQYVARGIDMMDCVLPSRNARNGYLFTSQGRVIIKHAQYKEDAGPLGSGMPLLHVPYLFARLSASFISGGEILYASLATRHNLQRYLDIMRRMRQAILLGNFPEYLASAGTPPTGLQ